MPLRGFSLGWRLELTGSGLISESESEYFNNLYIALWISSVE